MKFNLSLVAVFAALVCHPSDSHAQGNLTPPGPPAPTMKTLEQIESRTPISSVPYTLTRPGSYYVTTNLYGIASDYGIQIQTTNVTLDLNGFMLRGLTNSFDGIVIYQSSSNVVVRNGSLSGWGTGNNAVRGLAPNATFENLTVVGNGFGINCTSGSVIRDCVVSGNARDGIDVNGVGSLVLNNVLAGNNTIGGLGNANISIVGANNRIEGNHVTCGGAGYGIVIFSIAGSTNNIVIKNSVQSSGGSSYSLTAGNLLGPLINTTGVITNSNPWANFSF